MCSLCALWSLLSYAFMIEFLKCNCLLINWKCENNIYIIRSNFSISEISACIYCTWKINMVSEVWWSKRHWDHYWRALVKEKALECPISTIWLSIYIHGILYEVRKQPGRSYKFQGLEKKDWPHSDWPHSCKDWCLGYCERQSLLNYQMMNEKLNMRRKTSQQELLL